MRKLLDSSGVALAGLTTSVLTAILVVWIEGSTGFSLFTFSLLFFLPVGAIGCGFVAASGYFVGAKLLHQYPTWLLLLQMVVIAGFTQIGIYWLEYRMFAIDGVPVADTLSFADYLGWSLAAAHSMYRGSIDFGPVGEAGYLLAGIQFIGFLIGGAGVYVYLGGELKCSDCRKYLRPLAKKHDRFGDFRDFVEYSDQVYAHPVDSPEFARIMGASQKARMAGAGTMGLSTTLYQCPQCTRQSIYERVKVFDGREWQNAEEYDRYLLMPERIDVRPAFTPAA